MVILIWWKWFKIYIYQYIIKLIIFNKFWNMTNKETNFTIAEERIRKIMSAAIKEALVDETYNTPVTESKKSTMFDLILDECSVKHFKEIRYFSKDGKSLPNGIGFQRGNFLHECKVNSEAFLLNEDVHNNQYGLSKYRGGIIVFSTDVNAVSLDKNKILNKIKQIIATFKQRMNTGSILHKLVNSFNKYNKSEDYIGAYSIGNAFKGKYVGDNGEEYSERSTTIEINGLSTEGLLRLAEMIARIFHQETVLVKDLNKNKFYLANGLRRSETPDLTNINTMSENIQETSRRQKASAAMNGWNKNVKTMAILTSENPRFNGFSDGDNKTNSDRRENLEKDLKLGHFAWFPVKGQYEGKENSYIIYNISLENALYLGQKFGQESIIFIDGSHCEYWEQQGDGKYSKTHERDMSQRLDMTNADDYFTQISRAFKFQIPFFDGSDENQKTMGESVKYVCETIQKRMKTLEEAKKRIENSMEAKSGYNRFCNRGELYGNNFKW